MAANSRSVEGIFCFGKRVVNKIWTLDPPSRFPAISASALTLRRAAHNSVYDKNPDELIHPNIVPDDVIPQPLSEEYWAPHPQTGVFGPPIKNKANSTTTDGGDHGTVLEQEAWFRPTSLEDLEKPHLP